MDSPLRSKDQANLCGWTAVLGFNLQGVQLLGVTLGVTLGAEGDIHRISVCGQSIACDPATFLTAPSEEFLEEGCSKRRYKNMSAESQRGMMTSR